MDETRILRPAGANGASAEQALSRAGVYRHQAFAPRLLFHSQSLKVTPESPSPQVSACLVAKNFHMYVYLSLSLPLSPSPSLFLALFFFCISLSLSLMPETWTNSLLTETLPAALCTVAAPYSYRTLGCRQILLICLFVYSRQILGHKPTPSEDHASGTGALREGNWLSCQTCTEE